MSYFDDASLVMIPSGYKNQKVYSVKPLDGSGDLTFSRASSATRVASNGLIEKVRTNVVLRSEEQSDAQYAAVTNAIASRVAVLNPLTGVNNAYKITSNGSSDPYMGQNISGLSNGENTFSLWLWTDSGQNTSADLFFYNASATEVYAKNLTITTTPTRYSFTVNFTSIGASATVRLDLCQSCGVTYLYTYGWQAESGVMTDYIATTSAAVSVGPVSGLPRLDYLNSTCPRLLLEPQRTNLALYSEQFNNAYWDKFNTTISANSATAPDGTTSADKIIADANNSNHAIYKQTLISSGSATISVYAKAAGYNFIFLSDTIDLTKSAYFNLSNGTLGTIGANATASIQYAGNGWYRCVLTFTATSGSGIGIDLASANGTLSFAGNNVNGVLAWGAQVEAGAYATSYIPTLGTSVTRVADAASKTGISSLIGQTEGTLFAEIYPEEFQNGSYIGISDGANIANRIIFGFEGGSANSGTFQVYGASGLTGSGTYTRGQRMKVAIGYKSGSSALYVNGNLVDSKTTTFTATFTQFGFDSYAGTQNFVGKCSQLLISKTRLSNSDLATLTTL